MISRTRSRARARVVVGVDCLIALSLARITDPAASYQMEKPRTEGRHGRVEETQRMRQQRRPATGRRYPLTMICASYRLARSSVYTELERWCWFFGAIEHDPGRVGIDEHQGRRLAREAPRGLHGVTAPVKTERKTVHFSEIAGPLGDSVESILGQLC